MRKATLILLIHLLCSGVMIPAASAKTFVYVSNAQDGEIATLQMNPQNGALQLLGKTPSGKIVMPLAVSPDRRFLYASIRSIPYSVATYAINSATGALTHLSTVPLAADMDYISPDRTGRFLFSVSYSGAIITVNPIGLRGLVQPGPLQVIHTGSHPHAAPGHELQHQTVPNLSGAEDDLVDGLFLMDLPTPQFIRPKEFLQHGGVPWIRELGIQVIGDEVEEGFEIGITGVLG
ncbi:MAG: lactonase family protein [Thermodesulfobacteriota bacterium]